MKIGLFFCLLSLFSFLAHGHFSRFSRADDSASRSQDALRRSSTKRLLFDPLTTPIDVTGEHSFIPPVFKAGDQRGPCPGLNALANHGYIGRNGVTDLGEVTAAINQVYGMGLDLGGVLAIMGTVFVGDPLSLSPGFSIGGPTDSVENLLGNAFGLLGTPRGLIGSHNFIESDSSNTRDDLYVTGDCSTLDMGLFAGWYNMSSDSIGDFNMDLMAYRASLRFQQSIASNPYFYYGPYTGLVARNAGYMFAGRLFANHSQANPTGVLTKEILKSFYAISGEEGSFTYNRGWESIPQNWYRTPLDYDLVEMNLDMISWILKYPELGSIGGNTGTVNSFTGVDIGNLTGGIFNAESLLQGNNLICFVFEAVATLAPNSLSTLFSVLEGPLQLITGTLGSALTGLSCPALTELTLGGQGFEDVIQNMFPGARKSGGAF